MRAAASAGRGNLHSFSFIIHLKHVREVLAGWLVKTVGWGTVPKRWAALSVFEVRVNSSSKGASTDAPAHKCSINTVPGTAWV